MYKLNELKMFYDIAENQAIVINFSTGMYYGTSTLGSVVLDRVLAGYSVEKITAAIKALPECPEDIEASVEEFIQKLIENEIIVDGETVEGGDEAIGSEALEDGFVLTIDAFSEVQDLILADPVHDVDVEQGWPVMKED